MRKALEYILTVLAGLCVVLALIGRIHGYNNPQEKPIENKEDYSSFADNGTKFEFYTTKEENDLTTKASVEVSKDVKGHGNIKVVYEKLYLSTGDETDATLDPTLGSSLIKTTVKLDNNSIITKNENEVVESVIAFKDYLIINIKNLDDNFYEVVLIKNKKIEKTIADFDYNGFKFYITNIDSVNGDTFAFTASVLKDNMYTLSDGTSNDISMFPSEETYKAVFNINYVNKTLFEPTMTDVREKLNN